MRWILILMIFTHLSLIGMESSSEDSSNSPPLQLTPSSSSEELTDMEELTQQALSIFFEDEGGSMHTQSFSCELSRRIHPHIVQRNGNLRRLIYQRAQDYSQDRPPTPEQSLRKELRNIVIPTLTELFEEREKEHHKDKKKLAAERFKFKLAIITAGTTIFTTTAATITAVIIAMNS